MKIQSAHPLVTALAYLAIATILNGCVALAVAPVVASGVGLANGSTEGDITVTIDAKTFTESMRNTMLQAHHWAVIADGPGDVKAADLYETRGGFRVSVDRSTAKIGSMTGSERRETLRGMCNHFKSDLAMLGRISKKESGGMMAGALTGRAKENYQATMDVLACRTESVNSFDFAISTNIGIYNQKSKDQYDQMLGAEFGNKLLTALGK